MVGCVVGFGKRKDQNVFSRKGGADGKKKKKSNCANRCGSRRNGNQLKISDHPGTYIPNWWSHWGWFTLAKISDSYYTPSGKLFNTEHQ